MSQEPSPNNLPTEASGAILATKIACAIFVANIATGVVCNSLLLITTIRSKSLRSPCNILIGSCALFDVLHQSANFVQSYCMINQATISSFMCGVIMFLPELGVSGGTLLVLSIGFDRFFSIASPNRYRNMNATKYLFAHYTAIFMYCAYVTFLMIFFFRDQVQICSVAHVFHGDAMIYWSYSGVAVNLTAFVFYILTWRLIKSKSNSLEIEQLRRIFRTILLVTILELGGFTITQAIISTQHWFDVSVPVRVFIMTSSSIFVNAGIASKFIVYYFTSTEYRKAFKSLFHKENISKVLQSTST